eukprot:m.145161 g.145161  ORF g.145161 m.145161 type:complete len:515 (+) comp30422_c0_seq1:262-1806(+)
MVRTRKSVSAVVLMVLVSSFATPSMQASVDAGKKCDVCTVVAADLAAFVSNSSQVAEAVKELQTKVCDVKFKNNTKEKNICDEVAQGLGALAEFAYKEIATLAWDSVNLCNVVGLCKVPCCLTEKVPEQLHLALMREPSTMGIGWTTLNDTKTHSVQWGLSMDKLNFVNTEPGTSTTYALFGWVGVLHNAYMTNLLPGTRYYYRVGDNDTAWSKIWSFQTLPANVGSDERPLYAASVGDMGYASLSDNTVARLSSMVDDGRLDMVIHNGDISYADGEYHHWDVFMRKIESIAARVPYQVTPGNHEFWFNFSAYKHRFVMADQGAHDGLFYGLTVGKGIHFVGMDTESPLDLAHMSKSQVAFIEEELSGTSSAQDAWRIAYGHRPLYCSNHGKIQDGNWVLRLAVESTLVKNKVDLVIQAHVHDYERTWPVKNNGSTWSTNYTNANAPVYIVNGAAGNREGNPHPPVDKSWQPADQNATKLVSFGFMTISANTLQWDQIVALNGSVYDHFIIRKD